MLINEALDYLDSHINRRLTLEKLTGFPSIESYSRQLVTHTRTSNHPHHRDKRRFSSSYDCAALKCSWIISRPLQLSPVASITERIHINEEPISEEEFAENVHALSLAELHLEFSPSWFELVTAVAFRSFAGTAVDVAVMRWVC